ncbi:MAG: TIGR01459 family HAD-type hydrolase [Betaproteobacteria bacterium]|nr:TIGR01459 family HAD-type hydrolase [Betaproteobacteria bacterium]
MPAFPESAADRGGDFGGVVPVTGMARLAGVCDGLIVDQWGVLHDGTHAYPGAVACLERLRAAGKRIVVLSNSGKREAENVRLLARMGFDATLFDRVISAGENTRHAIQARADAFHRSLGRRCFAFTRDKDRSLLENIGLELVERVEDADFVAVIGIDSPRRGLPDYEPELRAAATRRLPMICANPDIVRVAAEGTIDAPGALARRYEALGGNVFYHGKPYPAIYASCLEALDRCAPRRVLAIGDSIEHDVLGATRAGIRSVFVAGGIHAGDLDITRGELPAPAAWRKFAAAAIASPDYLLPAFIW